MSRERRLLPPYLGTGGTEAPASGSLDRLTAVRATGLPLPSYHTPIQLRMVELVLDGSLSVIEVAGYLKLPVGASLMIAGQLVSDGQLEASDPVPDALSALRADRPSKAVMEEVLSGLRQLLVA
ncbi:DUF742 domain-containing protein [Streptomyces sp. HB132]|uniref:DUF742 domain-containing protein n=1 Tax=Streptomyces sp. HB132 TaxID=767388 RepID=UPI00195F9CCB|nr:DUF742 domain-containing protein [Streptomyces sp. HB132]